MKKLITLLMLMGVALTAFATQKALVIGNSTYPGKTLSHPVLETASADTILAMMGWQVTRHTNLGAANMRSSIQQFTQNISSADSLMVLYSGAAIQLDGVNWLIPSGKQFSDAATFKNQAISLDWLLTQTSKASLRMFLIDGAYQVPAVSFKVAAAGMAPIAKLAANTLVLFNAPANMWAADASGYYNKLVPSLRARIQGYDLLVKDLRQNIVQDISQPAGMKGITAPWFLNSIGDAIRVNPPPPEGQKMFHKGFMLDDIDGGGSYSF